MTTKVNFHPFHDRVLVLQAAAEDAPAGNIVIPDNDKEPPLEGRVVAVGPGRVEFGGWVNTSAYVGDVVLFSKYAGVPVVVEGQEYLLLRDEELLGRRTQRAASVHGEPGHEQEKLAARLAETCQMQDGQDAAEAKRAVPRIEQGAEKQ